MDDHHYGVSQCGPLDSTSLRNGLLQQKMPDCPNSHLFKSHSDYTDRASAVLRAGMRQMRHMRATNLG